MTNNKMKKLIFIGVFPFVVLFLLFSFVLWNFNPAEWTQDERFFYAHLSICGSIALIGLYLSENKPKR
jgi:protein-S-isoprenylcysteine O-methyltransferase Ste14